MRIVAGAIAAILAATPATAEDRLTVLLDWFVNPNHAPLVVAAERGLFAEHGLDVELVEPADPSAPPRLVAAGQGDIAITYQPNLHLQVHEGLPVARIGTLVETPLNSLMSLADGPIREIADLDGGTVGFSVGGFEDALLGAMLEEYGLGLDNVELVNVSFALSPSVISGQVDAVIGAYRNFELNQMDIEGHPGRAFYPEEHGVPVYDELIYVAHRDSLEDDRLSRFVAATEEATIWLINHPEEAWDLFVDANPQLDDELNRRAWADTLPRIAKRPAALDAGRYSRFARFMKARGLIDELVPVADYAIAFH